MPNRLIRFDDNGGDVVDDPWRIAEVEQSAFDGDEAWILPLKAWRQRGGDAVWLSPDADAEALLQDAGKNFGSLRLIALEFPKFNDGRGFSLARQLRNLGFNGELRAFGAFLPDQLHEMMRCGFDSFDPRGWSQSLESSLAQFEVFSESYQNAERPTPRDGR